MPIFCPAFTDCSAGFGLVKHQVDAMKRGGHYMTMDSIADFRELTDIKIKAGTTGLLMIGGGVPKNFAQDTVVCAEILGHEDVEVHKYAVQITVADVRDGACSSSTLQEAASWGKVSTALEQMVYRRGDLGPAAARQRRLSPRPLEEPRQAPLRQAVRLMKRLLALAVAAVMAAAPAAAAPRKPVDLLIRHATVVDVAAGRAISRSCDRHQRRRHRRGRTGRCDRRRFAPGAASTPRGKFVMPGLWDMHVHFGGGAELIEENKALLPLYVAYGVTTVRDAAADLSASVLSWRTEIAAGKLLGPTIFTSGPKLEGYKPLWKGTIEVGTPAEVDAALDRLQAMKVDFVKITDNTLKPDIFLYAVEAAKKRGLKTSAHTPFALTIEQAAAAGPELGRASRLSDQGRFARGGEDRRRLCGRKAQLWRCLRPVRRDLRRQPMRKRVYRRLAATGLYVTPTLNMGRILAYLDREDHRNDPALALIGPGLRKTYEWRVERAAKATPAQIAARHREYELSVKVLPMLRDAGIPILAGTDAGYLNSFNYPGQGLHDELQRYVEAGPDAARGTGQRDPDRARLSWPC